MRMKSAWLGTWEGTQEDGKRIAFILNSRLGSDTVKCFVERLSASMTYSPREMLVVAKNNKDNPYPVEYGDVELPSEKRIKNRDSLFCGHNPFIHARRVINLEFIATGKHGEGELTWEEFPKSDVSWIES